MRNLIPILFFVFGGLINLHATDIDAHYDSLYQAGNNAYQEQKYDSALLQYSAILNSGLESADLYYNFGNAHYKMSHVAEAILYYEKSLRLNPSNPDVIYNLDLANKLIVDKIESLPVPFYTDWKNSLINGLLYDQWGYISIAFMVISMLWLLIYFFTRRAGVKRISFYLFIVLLMGSGITYLFAKSQYKQVKETPYAIIFETRTNVYSEPLTSSSLLFVTHSGLKVQILKNESKWYNIMLPDGSVGWIPVEVAVEI